jgi:hypothetical protein
VLFAGLVVVGYGLLATLYAWRDVAQAQTTKGAGGPPTGTGKPTRLLTGHRIAARVTPLPLPLPSVRVRPGYDCLAVAVPDLDLPLIDRGDVRRPLPPATSPTHTGSRSSRSSRQVGIAIGNALGGRLSGPLTPGRCVLRLQHLLPSLVVTAEPGFRYLVVIGYDAGDAFYDTDHGRARLQQWFQVRDRRSNQVACGAGQHMEDPR